ncbi:MAG: HPr family phosphocarrier protein [Victivallales bacterium]|nr:HPr family phosphocarrier protein [Victivallales bacterium]
MSSSLSKDVITVRNSHGLHLRVASELARLCRQFQAKITLGRPGEPPVNIASPLSLLTLAVTAGTKLEAVADGPDADAALAAVVEYFTMHSDAEK